MTAPRRAGGAPPTGSSAVLRGAVLVGVAVILGLALLAKGFPESKGSGATGTGDETTTTADADTTTTTAAAAPHQPAEVKVWVTNGSGLVGVAGTATNILNGKGYTTIAPANTPNNTKVPATVIYFVDAYAADAQAIATALGTAATAVQAMPAAGTQPALPVDLQGANVVVILGPDFKAG